MTKKELKQREMTKQTLLLNNHKKQITSNETTDELLAFLRGESTLDTLSSFFGSTGISICLDTISCSSLADFLVVKKLSANESPISKEKS